MENIYWFKVSLESIKRGIWNKRIIVKVKNGEIVINETRTSAVNGTIVPYKFAFEWNTRNLLYEIEIIYEKEMKEEKKKIEFPISEVIHDIEGGQKKEIEINEEIGIIKIEISENEWNIPTALSICDSEMLKNNILYCPKPASEKPREGSHVYNNIIYPKKLVIAIDLTISNQPPDKKDSLHSENLEKNCYYTAIKKFSELISYISSLENMPLLGFGFKDNERENEYCENMMMRYWQKKIPTGCGMCTLCYEEILKETVKKGISLDGPTSFKIVLEKSEKEINKNEHGILLLFTDGACNDGPEFISYLNEVNKSKFISVILVIVGNNLINIENIRKDINLSSENLMTLTQEDVNNQKFYEKSTKWLEKRSHVMADRHK